MATQDATARARIAAQLMRDVAATGAGLTGITKADVQAAVAAADDWRDANAASFNAALPATFRANATAGQKALLLAYVVMRFYGNLRAEEDG